ncbi:MAG: hypothetical protein U0324_29825 [Polyangiales bacterium]
MARRDADHTGDRRVVVVQPCYQSKGTIMVIVHGVSAVTVRAPAAVDRAIEQVVNRGSDAHGQDGRGARVRLDVRATRALVRANLKLTHHGEAAEKRGSYVGQEQGAPFRVEAGRWTVRATAGALTASKEVVAFAGETTTVHLWLGAVFAEAAFTQRSKRTLPDQDGWALARRDVSPLVFTRRVAVPEGDGDFDVELVVDLGLGGGDKCAVGVGLDAACDAATRTFENWRVIDYEVIAAKANGGDRLTDTLAPYLEDNGGPDFSADIRGRLAGVLTPLYIRYRRLAGAYYAAGDVAAVGGANVLVESDHFRGAQAGRRVTVLSAGKATALLNRLRSQQADDRASRMTMIFCDYLSNGVNANKTYVASDVEGPTTVPLGEVDGILPRRLDVAGASAVLEFQWQVTGGLWDRAWRASIDLPNNLRVKLDTGLTDGATAHAAVEPGLIRLTFPELPDGGIVQARPAHNKIVLRDGRLFHCYLINDPDDLDMYGDALTALRGACAVERNGEEEFALIPVRLRVEVALERRLFDFNAQASRGAATFALGDPSKGPAAWQGLTRTLLHELGHCMGQVYGSVASMNIWGRDDDTLIPGVPFPPALPDGAAYEDHDHNGPHCAAHLSGAERQEEHFRPYSDRGGKCVMWGEGDLRAARLEDFCAACQKHLLAEDLRDIVKKWGPNMPG